MDESQQSQKYRDEIISMSGTDNDGASAKTASTAAAITNPETSTIEFDVTDKQKEAILASYGEDQINSIIAGPGCGKTQLLIYRIAYLLSVRIQPSEILVLSLTNMAVRNVKSKLKVVFGDNKVWEKINVCTFHAFAYHVVNEESSGKQLKLMDTLDWQTVVKMVNSKHVDKYNIMELLGDVDATKLTEKEEDNIKDDSKIDQRQLKKIIAQLDRYGLVSFKSMMERFTEILKKRPEIINDRYKVVMIDEFQDINKGLLGFVKCIFGSRCHVTVAGDPSQSIYGFLGSHKIYENMKKFLPKNSSKRLKEYQLTESFRSTKELIRFSNKLTTTKLSRISTINNEPELFEPTLRSFGEPALALDYACQEILRLIYKSGGLIKPKDILVLASLNSDVAGFSNAASIYGLKTTKTSEFPEWMESSSAYLMHFLKILVDARGSDFSLLSCIMLISGMRQSSIEKIWQSSMASKQPVWDVLEKEKLTSAKMRDFVEVTKKRIAFYDNPKNWNKVNDPHFVFHDLLSYVQEASCDKKIFNMKDLSDSGAFALKANLKSFYEGLIKAAKSKSDEVSLGKWFVTVYNDKAANMEAIDFFGNENDHMVNISTIHSAKGLEFPVVFVLCEYETMRKLLNNQKESSRNESSDSEEKRRLFYVASTRASLLLYFSQWPRKHYLGLNTPESEPLVTGLETGLSSTNLLKISNFLKRPMPIETSLTTYNQKYSRLAAKFRLPTRNFCTFVPQKNPFIHKQQFFVYIRVISAIQKLGRFVIHR